jgi:hypothetical protein
LLVLGGGFFFLTLNRSMLWPMKIVGGAPGNYLDGDYVVVASVQTFNADLNKGDVIIFNQPRYEAGNKIVVVEGSEMVGELIGLEGDPVNETTTYYNDQYIQGQVPKDHVLVRLNDGIYWRAIPRDLVIGKVIYPKK